MPGPVQKAMGDVVSTASAVAVGAKKLHEHERQAHEKATIEAQVEEKDKKALEEEAEKNVLEADLIRLGADPESARAYINAKELGLDTNSFGMIRKQGKFVGSYSSLADKLAKDALTDSLSSKLINEKGFSERVMKLGGTRKGRVEALVNASKGGKK